MFKGKIVDPRECTRKITGILFLKHKYIFSFFFLFKGNNAFIYLGHNNYKSNLKYVTNRLIRFITQKWW